MMVGLRSCDLFVPLCYEVATSVARKVGRVPLDILAHYS